MYDTFEIYYSAHERNARRIILENKLESAEKLALMSAEDIEEIINKNYICISCSDDWLLISNDKSVNFNEIVKCCKGDKL